MKERFYLYHKDYSPEGTIFEAEDKAAAYEFSLEKAKNGWVDSPAKIGVNLWGEQGEEGVAVKKAFFESGRIPAIDKTEEVSAAEIKAELEKIRLEAEKAKEEAKALRQEESLLKKKSMADEKFMDEMEDAELNKKGSQLPAEKKLRRKRTPKLKFVKAANGTDKSDKGDLEL